MVELRFNEISMVVQPNYNKLGLYDVGVKYPQYSKYKMYQLRREDMGFGYYWYIDNNSLRLFETEQSWISRDMMFDLFKNLVSELEFYKK